ncbi:MAG: glycosyltransferase family 4 protein [Saprospiraceae bacterium]|jgi:glycosyltransferase involved in cell wall biosynthesis|nr:glycosyltransferase family 4 protein [Saprospiraceae bacterium]
MPTKKILLVANTAWNLWNYRRALIRALQTAGYEVVTAAPDDRFGSFLETRFIPLKHLSRRSFAFSQNLLALLELYRLLKRERPDAVLFYTIKPNILGNLAAQLSRTPAISVVEGLGYNGTSAAHWRWLAAPLYRLALLRTRRVVFLNRDDAQEFLQQKLVTQTQCRILPGPGIDTEYFCQPAFAKVTADKPDTVTFLFCGRLLYEKGIREFVEAARAVRQAGATAVFRVLGNPDPGNPSSIEPVELDTWRHEGIVQFYDSADDVRPQLAEADVLVLPSYYREGVPRSVLEAMAMGKIIVTTDTPGCRDTVEEGQNGFLIPPRRADLLAQTMLRVLGLPKNTRTELGRHSREKVIREFSDAEVLPQYLALLTELLVQE